MTPTTGQRHVPHGADRIHRRVSPAVQAEPWSGLLEEELDRCLRATERDHDLPSLEVLAGARDRGAPSRMAGILHRVDATRSRYSKSGPDGEAGIPRTYSSMSLGETGWPAATWPRAQAAGRTTLLTPRRLVEHPTRRGLARVARSRPNSRGWRVVRGNGRDEARPTALPMSRTGRVTVARRVSDDEVGRSPAGASLS